MSRFRVVLILAVVTAALVAPGTARANPPGFSLTLSGPAEYDPGIPVSFNGVLSIAGVVGLPLQNVELRVDGVTTSIVQTGVTGAWTASHTFGSGAPYSHVVQAVAFSGGALETTSPQQTINMHVVLTAITVTPQDASVPKGLTQQLNATGTYNNGSTADVTASALWSSADTAVAVVSNAAGNKGRVTGQVVGTTTITATVGSVAGGTSLTVTPPVLQSITVTPQNASVPGGFTQQLNATGTYSDGTAAALTDDVTWSSSNTMVATISNAAGSKGLASGFAQGVTTIQATLGSVSGETSLTVSAPLLQGVTVTPADPAISIGQNIQFTATGSYSDGSTQDITSDVTWSSSNSAVADIDNGATAGRAHGTGVGQATITATSGSVAGITTLTVVGSHIVLNEIDYDQASTDTGEFIEIFNPTASSLSLEGLAVVLVNGNGALEYKRVTLSGTIPAFGFVVVATSSVAVPPPAVVFPFTQSQDNVQNGAPDSVIIFDTAANIVIDALSYEGSTAPSTIAGAPGLYAVTEGSGVPQNLSDDPTSPISQAGSLVRNPDGFDTDSNSGDWSLSSNPTPGADNIA